MLLPPQHLRRYRPRNKIAHADAKALPEAFRDEAVHPVPLIYPLSATALAGFVGDLRRLNSARRLARRLGLTSRERSSAAIRRPGAASKRGEVCLRMLLIHGARALLAAAPPQREPDRIRKWALELAARVGHNKATVALANKLARYAWVVATRDRDFEVRAAAA